MGEIGVPSVNTTTEGEYEIFGACAYAYLPGEAKTIIKSNKHTNNLIFICLINN